MSFFNFFVLFGFGFVCLFALKVTERVGETEAWGKRRRDRYFMSPVHSPDGCNGQHLASQRPGVSSEYPMWVAGA